MSNSSTFFTVDIVFNLISTVMDILALLICFTLIFVIIYRIIRLNHNRRQVINDVPLILSINIIFVIFIKSTLQITHVSFPTLIKDFYPKTEFKETPMFRYRAYMLLAMIGVLFWSYALLSFFSFVRVVYPRKLWFHRSSLYLYILIPGLFAYVFIANLPLLVGFDSLHLIPNEAYCGVTVIPIYPILYTNTVSFLLPINIICVFYIRIARKMRQTTVIRQNLESIHRRDFIVLRRMVLNIVILGILSIPFLILFIISLIQNYFGSILYRVQWISSAAGSLLFSCILPFVSTRLHDFLKPNRLVPRDNQNIT